MFRKLAFLAVLVMLASAVFASAANLAVNGGTVMGGADNVLYCDPDGIQVVAYGLNTYPEAEGVAFITVKGVAAACNGARIMGRVYAPGWGGGNPGDYAYTSGAEEYGDQTPKFVIANGDSNTEYRLFLKTRAMNEQVYIPAEYIEEVKLWVEGETQ